MLGVPRDATPKDIASAYLKLAKRWHPDRKVVTDAAQQTKVDARFIAICNAGNTLRDPTTAAAYLKSPSAHDSSKLTKAEAISSFMNFCVEDIKAKQKLRRSPIKLFVMTLLPLGCDLGKGPLGATLSPAFTKLLNGSTVTEVLAGMTKEEQAHFYLAIRTLADDSA